MIAGGAFDTIGTMVVAVGNSNPCYEALKTRERSAAGEVCCWNYWEAKGDIFKNI